MCARRLQPCQPATLEYHPPVRTGPLLFASALDTVLVARSQMQLFTISELAKILLHLYFTALHLTALSREVTLSCWSIFFNTTRRALATNAHLAIGSLSAPHAVQTSCCTILSYSPTQSLYRPVRTNTFSLVSAQKCILPLYFPIGSAALLVLVNDVRKTVKLCKLCIKSIHSFNSRKRERVI